MVWLGWLDERLMVTRLAAAVSLSVVAKAMFQSCANCSHKPALRSFESFE